MAGAPRALEPGQVFAGDYEIVKPLAQGGMGALYVVTQRSTGKSRALKVMRPELAGSEDARRRFELEAKVGAKIESEHVVEIHSAGVDAASGAPYLVMELLSGEDLATRIERAPLGTTETAAIFEQLCHAIASAHDASIVHRDLKPENVFLAKTRRAGNRTGDEVLVKVLDFGIAKLVAEAATKSGTAGGIGTPLWMAPEQADPGKITASADVWALGLIVYHALTGRSFWRAGDDPEATYTQLLKEIVMGPIPLASERAREQGLADRIPAALDDVLARTLTRNPKDRIQNARSFWEALAPALAWTPAPASSARVVVPADPVSAREIAAKPLERTAEATPAPRSNPGIANPAPVPPPPIVGLRPPHVPAPAPQSRFWSETVRPHWLLLFGFIALVGVFTVGYRVQKALSAKRTYDPVRVSRPVPIGANPTSVLTVSPRPIRCRFCADDIAVQGPLDRATVAQVIDRAAPSLESDCMGHGRPFRGGKSTFSFDIKDGEPTNRTIVSTTSANDGPQECIVRALRDVRFPAGGATTNVTVTFRYDPTVR